MHRGDGVSGRWVRAILLALCVGVVAVGRIAASAEPAAVKATPGTEKKEQEQGIYYDNDGLIVHKGLDGGDTTQREGWYWLGVWIRKEVLHDPWTTPRQLTF